MDATAIVELQKSEIQKLIKWNLNTNEVNVTIKHVTKWVYNGYAVSYTNHDGDSTENDDDEDEEKMNQNKQNVPFGTPTANKEPYTDTVPPSTWILKDWRGQINLRTNQ